MVDYKNIFLDNTSEKVAYTSKRSGGSFSIPFRNRIDHGTKLLRSLNKIWETNDDSNAISLVRNHGTYIDFFSSQDYELKLNSLEFQSKGIKLLNVHLDDTVTKATVFIPKGEEHYFSKKISQYLLEDNKKGDKPKNNDLVASINDIKEALIPSFWFGKKEDIPNVQKKWCEVWISSDTHEDEVKFRDLLSTLNIDVKPETLTFPERKVFLARINGNDISNIINCSELLAELRLSLEANSLIIDLPNYEQSQLSSDLLARTTFKLSSNSVLVLDRGINNGHLLISPVLKNDDRLSYKNEWGVEDDSSHGTGMSGIIVYGDLKEKLLSSKLYNIDFSLESYKILPPVGNNERSLYGAITIEGISSFYLKNFEKKRIICMAVTEQEENNDGTPSSWSAALDETTSGAVDDIKKLFIISAGNIEPDNYPDENIIASIQSPAQSWNALTVGAYTDIVNFDDAGSSPEYNVVASHGGLSPYSRTSLIWDKKWPIKPEVVFEGGNRISDGRKTYSSDKLDMLTTYYKPHERNFDNFHGTSCATALAGNFAANLMSAYPNAWPETIRALIVHSASWTDEMIRQFNKNKTKKDYYKLLRTCGYGVPNYERAIQCANNYVNLIVEDELQPFKRNDKGRIITNDMNIHKIPWPKEVLEDIYDKKVEMKVTLSYFIEPGPNNVGWKNKYRYPSCNLRFEVNGNDNKEDFIKRISKVVAAEEKGEEYSSSSSVKWLLGPTKRNVGSIHSDVWIGNGADLVDSNYIAVFPSTGWWKERANLGSYNKKIRYSLIISLYTEETSVDLYTSIKAKIKTSIPIEIKSRF